MINQKTTTKEAELDLLNDAIRSFNKVSETLLQYYKSLEEKVEVLTKEVDHKKQLLNSILDSIDIGVVFFDTSGVVRLTNRAAGELLQIPPERLVGMKDICKSINADTIVPHNGKPFFALISQRDVIDNTGNLIGNVLIFKDITRLRELESQNERNRRLTAMGELVMKIAHEIRNPLGSIELFAGLLKDDLKGTEQGLYAQKISNSVRSLVTTLDNMLSFTKEIKPKVQAQSINLMMDEIVDEFRGYLQSSNVEIRLVSEQDITANIDKGLMRQAILNLLINAVQAMPTGGSITIKISRKGDDFFNIEISDTGVGIDEDKVANIFEPFFSTKDRGTGLGLSITAGIITAHGGSISVKSKIDEGSVFEITLPVGER
ncbi:MAG: ATP-binding protein [Thermodesulfovibrionales bacterium]|nr:ATP-binding protein [Thermodesulfovibrionales bacterium]